MLQYQAAYINDTPIVYEEGNESIGIDQRLRLVTVALLEKDANKFMLEFLVSNRNSIWPSKKLFELFNLSTAVSSFFHSQLTFQLMVYQEQK